MLDFETFFFAVIYTNVVRDLFRLIMIFHPRLMTTAVSFDSKIGDEGVLVFLPGVDSRHNLQTTVRFSSHESRLLRENHF